MTPDSQCARILKYLQSGRSVSPLMALDRFGTMRLSARILEIKNAGHKVESKRLKVGEKWIAAYNMLDRA